MKWMTLIATLVLSLAAVSAGQEITVAAAADLNFAMKEIAAKYEAQSSTKVKLTFGSSGNLTAGIRNGAPYDLFFSADAEYPKQLETAGLTESGTMYEYAIGHLVLWVPQDSKLDVSKGWPVLEQARKISIANPQHAPYGRAAVAAMKSAGVYESALDKLVLGENISQTAQFVQTGNAEVGVLALSLALAPTAKGKYWLVPADTYPPIRQAAVMLQRASDKQAARKFLEFMKSDASREILKRYGFEKP